MNHNQDLKLLTNETLTNLARVWYDALQSDHLSKKEYLQLMSNLHSLESIWDQDYHRNPKHVTTAEPVNQGIQMKLPLVFLSAEEKSSQSNDEDFCKNVLNGKQDMASVDHSNQMIDKNDTFRLPNELKDNFRTLFNQLFTFTNIMDMLNVYPNDDKSLLKTPNEYSQVLTFMDDLIDGKHYSHKDNHKFGQLIDDMEVTNQYLDKVIKAPFVAQDSEDVVSVFVKCKDILHLIQKNMINYVKE